MYGEPWQGGQSMLRRYEAEQGRFADAQYPHRGVSATTPGTPSRATALSPAAPGYVEGKQDAFWDIGAAVGAWCLHDRVNPRAPSQIISYVSAHDNLTLWDKLLAVRYKKPDYSAAPDTILAQNRLAAGIYLTCMGTPFMQAGEEFARTKKGIKDSYRSPCLHQSAGLGPGRPVPWAGGLLPGG